MTDPKIIPPHSADLERSMLGYFLLDPSTIDAALEVWPAAAYTPSKDREPILFVGSHQVIMDAILTMHREGITVTLQTLAEVLRAENKLELAGGAALLSQLEDGIYALQGAEATARFLLAMWKRRRMLKVLQRGISACADESKKASEVLESIEAAIYGAATESAQSGFSPIGASVPEVITIIERRTAGVREEGIATGFPDLDRMTGGLRGGQFVVLAARPSVGKTALALNIADKVAVADKRPVAIFSLEMSREELTERMIAIRSRVATRKRGLNQFQLEHVRRAAQSIHKAPIYIDDTPVMTALEIRSRCRRLISRHGIQLIIVDYLQLLTGSGRSDNRNNEVAEMSRWMKLISGEFKVPVLVLSQLSRDMEKGPRKREPRLSDLRDSGAIEQDADMIWFLTRNLTEGMDADRPVDAQLLIRKQRNGPLGDIDLLFNGKITLFTCKAECEGSYAA